MVFYGIAFILSFFIDASIEFSGHFPIIMVAIFITLMILGFRRDWRINEVKGSWQVYALFIIPTFLVMIMAPYLCTVTAFLIATTMTITHIITQHTDRLRFDQAAEKRS
jgi:uncharacterized membrane protein YhaH (DUF805 family)